LGRRMKRRIRAVRVDENIRIDGNQPPRPS
jgi:hypothetical protein